MPSGGQCRSYFYGRGLYRFVTGRRCWLVAGHAGQHETWRSGLGAPFTFRWGRINTRSGER
jgi:hypothetical protein